MKGLSFAIVFDFDGTLIDSRDVKTGNYVQAFEAVFKTDKKARATIIESCVRTSGANRFIQLSDTLNSLGLTATEEQKEAWSKNYSSMNSKALATISEFPSVRKILEELKKAGCSLFATSGILEEEFRGELARRRLRDFFIEAKGGNKLSFLNALKGRELQPILFVGDTDYDEKTAREARVLFYRIEKDEDIINLPHFLLKMQL